MPPIIWASFDQALYNQMQRLPVTCSANQFSAPGERKNNPFFGAKTAVLGLKIKFANYLDII